MEAFKHDPKKPLVLLLGSVNHEGIISALSAASRQYKQKYPESTLKNWPSILKQFEDFSVGSVIWKVGPEAFNVLASPDYQQVADQLLARIASTPHAIFVHQDLLSGKGVEAETGFSPPSEAIRIAVSKMFAKHGIRVLPYAKNAELTVSASEFIAQTEQGLLMRIYVPSGRMWAEETGRLLQLFRDYLAKVGSPSVRLNQTRTDRGTIYEFHGDGGEVAARNLSKEFEEFSQLMDLCVAHPDKAQELLSGRALSPQAIQEILTRYSKEASRLRLDLKHDREQKILSIRQRMESELSELDMKDVPGAAIEALIDSVVPKVLGVGAAPAVDRNALLPLQGSAQNITVNVNSQVVQAVGSIVAKEVHGNNYLTPQDQQLLDLIQKHAPENAAELASAVHELGDPSAPQPGRLVAKQKLQQFLFSAASKLGDAAAGVLQSYVERQLGLR